MSNYVQKVQNQIAHFFTLKVANQVLAFVGNLLKPFSLVSNEPILPKEQFEWVTHLEKNAPAIKAELMHVLQNEAGLPSIQDIQPAESLLSKDQKWKTFFLKGFGHKAAKNCAQCPNTTAVLDEIPDVLTAFFSILHPGKHIPAHKGIFKGIIRTHLGLVIPINNSNCKMRVHNSFFNWEEGKAVVFDDTYNHEVWNDTNSMRVVLLIDTKRPYKGIAARINNAIINSITNSVYVKDALQKNENWEKTYYQVMG